VIGGRPPQSGSDAFEALDVAGARLSQISIVTISSVTNLICHKTKAAAGASRAWLATKPFHMFAALCQYYFSSL
jgi:hypothetical protein